MKRLKHVVSANLFFVMCLSPLGYADATRDALIDLNVSSGIQKSEVSARDGKAYVYKVKGKATLIKAGSPIEGQVKKGDLIQAGDKIFTEDDGEVTIGFDYMKKNAVQIPKSTHAIFNSIEPTDIKLEDGTVFSAVDGLAKGSTWKVTTPVAVAAVRGTVYLVTYEATNGDFFAATVDIPDDNKISSIEILPMEGEGLAAVAEGKEISLKEGQAPDNAMVENLKPENIQQITQFFQTLKQDRMIPSDEAMGDALGDENNDHGPNDGPGSGPRSEGPSNASDGPMGGSDGKNPAVRMPNTRMYQVGANHQGSGASVDGFRGAFDGMGTMQFGSAQGAGIGQPGMDQGQNTASYGGFNAHMGVPRDSGNFGSEGPGDFDKGGTEGFETFEGLDEGPAGSDFSNILTGDIGTTVNFIPELDKITDDFTAGDSKIYNDQYCIETGDCGGGQNYDSANSNYTYP